MDQKNFKEYLNNGLLDYISDIEQITDRFKNDSSIDEKSLKQEVAGLSLFTAYYVLVNRYGETFAEKAFDLLNQEYYQKMVEKMIFTDNPDEYLKFIQERFDIYQSSLTRFPSPSQCIGMQLCCGILEDFNIEHMTKMSNFCSIFMTSLSDMLEKLDATQ